MSVCPACGQDLPLFRSGLCEECESHIPAGVVTCMTPTGIRAEFVTKDSGERQDFTTGARRDIQTGKPRFDLIPVGPLTRLANLYARGAEKYGDHNWQKGMPISRCYASLFRHLMQWVAGDQQEDHLAAVVFNAFAIMFYEEQVDQGKLPAELKDMP